MKLCPKLPNKSIHYIFFLKYPDIQINQIKSHPFVTDGKVCFKITMPMSKSTLLRQILLTKQPVLKWNRELPKLQILE